jgi:hypothetical protein
VRSSAADWDTLTRVVAGEVVVAGSPGYDAVHKPAMARFRDLRRGHPQVPRASGCLGGDRVRTARHNGASRTGGQFQTGLATQGPSGSGPVPARR